jgi:hypothetical protein
LINRDDTDEEGDKDESAGSHDTGFEQLAREQKEEEKIRKDLNKWLQGSQIFLPKFVFSKLSSIDSASAPLSSDPTPVPSWHHAMHWCFL